MAMTLQVPEVKSTLGVITCVSGRDPDRGWYGLVPRGDRLPRRDQMARLAMRMERSAESRRQISNSARAAPRIPIKLTGHVHKIYSSLRRPPPSILHLLVAMHLRPSRRFFFLVGRYVCSPLLLVISDTTCGS